MKKLFLKLSMLLFVLGMSTNVAWANEAWVYFMSLKAESSQESTGSGKVKLTWIDVQGVPFVGNDLACKLNYAGGLPYNVISPAQSPEENVFDETAQLIGVTMYAMDGVELPILIAGEGSQIYMTAYTYFHAENQPDDGSYFAGWTFTDPAITRQDTAMGGDLKNALGGLTGESTPKLSPCFKVLPSVESKVWYDDTDPSTMMGVAEMAQTVVANPNMLYAIFNKYLLSNPQSTNGQVETTVGDKAQLTVSVDVEGDVASFDVTDWTDFAAFSFTNNENDQWSYNMSDATSEILSASRVRVTIPVTFTAKTGITPGAKTTTMTISMAGNNNPSSLNISLSVNALDATRPYAELYSGKIYMEHSGTLTEMIDYVQNNTVENPVIKLHRNCTVAVNPSKSLTLDLNGNTLDGTLTADGENVIVTLAYSKQGGVVTGAVNAQNQGKIILNGGKIEDDVTIASGASMEQNGAVITGSVTNYGTLLATEGAVHGGLNSTGNLTIDGGSYAGANAVEISGGTANINRGTLNGTECGLLVSDGTANVKKLAAITSEGDYSAKRIGGTLNVQSGKFGKPLNGTINFTAGYFKNTNYGVPTEGKVEMLNSAGVEYDEGYHYFLGDAASGIANGVGVCRIGTTSYARLEDAIAYANNNPAEENVVIFMTNNYTLPAGYYTLPANATIVVPMSDTPAKEVNKIVPRVTFHDLDRSHPYVTPYEFRRLTFANGVNMDVFGAIEMTCTQFASNEAYTAQPTGAYGHLVMEEGSHITLQNGSELRAWGFMTGKGETDARRGSKVCEMFQMGDWKGAMTSVKITGMAPSDMIADDSDKKIFPVSQYFIQNVESPVKYHPGGVLAATATVAEGVGGFLAVSMSAADIKVVGVSGTDDAIFLMSAQADADNTWVRKWYDAENDIQVYDINSGAHIGSMVIDMGELYVPFLNFMMTVRLNSAAFDLPITNNMKIHLLTGDMDFKQNTCLLPGAEVEVDKESTVSVSKDNSDPDHTGALYIYDADQWGTYAFCNVAVDDGNGNWHEVHNVAYTKVVRYAQSWDGVNPEGRPTLRDEQTCPPDAKINVHGTFQTATGFVYTSASGANIFSSNEDAGTFIFNQDASNAGTRYVNQIANLGETGIGGRNTHITATNTPFTAAQLKNGNGGYVETSSAIAGDAYCYQNDEWSTMTVDEDDPCFMETYNGNTEIFTYYAKPAEYVAVVATKDGEGNIIGNSDHTYSDAAGAGRLFILMDGCQWWEVEKKNNLYHCIHPENDTYYYWGEDESDEEKWLEKKFTITWKNWDGTEVTTDNGNAMGYEVTYGTMAEFLGTNPTREKTIDYTYDFAGWSPALGPVTSDVTYTATYTQKDRMYTIVFQNEGGVEIERQFLKHNDIPVCENVPTKVGHTLEWSPAIAAVTGDAIYTATWLEEPPTKYEVTFFDYDGTTVLQKTNVDVGDMPEYNGATPTGKATWAEEQENKEFTYVFDHWSPALEVVSATSIKSYTAVYREVEQTYTVRFYQEDRTTQIGDAQSLTYGAMPEAPNYTKEETGYTITVLWKNKADVDASAENPRTIETVKGNADYIADVTTLRVPNKYTVTVKSNPSGACSISGAGLYDYNTSATITLSVNDGYTFTGWSDGLEETNTSRTITVTEDKDLVANFTVDDPDVTITWMNEAGTANLVAPVGQKANTATIYTGAIPTKTADANYVYTFDGWTTSPNSAGTFYKNNMTPKATADATYYAHFAATEVIMEVGVGQAQNVAEATTVNQLIINSNGTVSGQLTGAALLNVTGACYYDLTGTFNAGKWYAVAVPWQVTAGDIRANGNALSWMSGDYLAYYDGSVRAAQGKVDACWKYLSNGSTLEPGRLYMLYLANNASVLRFPKKAGTQILTSETSVSTYGSDEPTNANWNGIANPAVFYAYLSNTGATVGQVFNADAQSYEAVSLSNKLIVAKPIFVQATNNGSAVALTTPPASAPVRRNAAAKPLNAEYQVEIASYGRMQDRLFIHANESKEADTYTLGQDVLKFGVSDKVAQMWVDRYDSKLCMNTMAPVDGVTEFPLSIFAPKAGEYQISNVQSQMTNDNDLYLTYNGEAIWNLSEGAYTFTLNKGTTTSYGLRISAKKAPEVATGIDEAVVDAQGETVKMLINGQVFIIRGNNVYSIDGQLVK